MKVITEYKNNDEIIEVFTTIKEVKKSCIGWLEVYEDIDDTNYHSEKNKINQANDLKRINRTMNEFGYSYK